MTNTVSGTSSTSTSANTTSTTQVNSNATLGKDDFIKLLVAQMQNQDPMNPTDSTQSIAQMAQFSSLEQMTNISTSMDSLNKSMTNFIQQSALMQGSAMIGKSVSGVNTDGTTPIEGTVEAVKWLDGDPMLQVRKADGTLVDLEMGLITLVQDQPTTSTSTSTATAVVTP